MLNSEELSKLRKAGDVAAKARDIGLGLVKAGAKFYDVAEEVEGYIRSHGCGLAFPCNLSRNEIAAHYTPATDDKSVFEIGDVVKVDCGAELDGYVGDTAGTVEVGTNNYRNLIDSSRRARNSVAEFMGAGTQIGDIGRVVEMTITGAGFQPIRNLCGHQIKPYNLHAGVSIPNYDDGDKTKIELGSIIAVEPFATTGVGRIKNNAPWGGIVRLLRERPLADPKAQEFLEYVKGEFKTFPFCARSCDFKDAEKYTKLLIRHGVLSSYSLCVEASGGIVSQHEYTFYISGPRAEVTTLP
ncbi:MAG: type II methionyl aminopeptidase [Candidatus Methanoplasma sp.]|jgi:methionyl aminopeptidase|nr:type II methionyl aminopeptidase [Candidatus Methanoplasma sp.]